MLAALRGSARWLGVDGLVALGVVGYFLFLKTYSFHPTATDDWIYAYMAERVTEGRWPYRDFFFAHPPLHLFALVPTLALFGFDVQGVRMAAALGCATAGFCLWGAVRSLAGGTSGGLASRAAGIVGLVAFLFAYDVLRSSSHITGTNLSLAFTAAGAWALAAARPRLGAAFLACAGLVAFYVMPVAFGLLGLQVWRHRRRAFATTAVFLACFLGGQVIAAIPAPGKYVQGVYEYHRKKPDNPDRSERTWTRMFAYHRLGLLGPPLAVGGWLLLASRKPAGERSRVRKRDRHDGSMAGADARRGAGEDAGDSVRSRLRGALLGVLLIAGLETAALSALPELFAYYLVALHALLAAMLGLGAAAWLRALPELRRGARRGWTLGIAGVTAAVGVLLWTSLPTEAAFLRPGGRSKKEWSPSPVGTPLDALTKALFFRELHTFGEGPNPITLYLWHEADYLKHIDAAARAIRERARPGDLCIGDSQIGPLLALETDMKIVDDEADTNTKRFRSGLISVEAFIEKIDRPELRWAFFADDRYLDSSEEFKAWRRREFVPVFQKLDEGNHLITAAERRTPDTAR